MLASNMQEMPAAQGFLALAHVMEAHLDGPILGCRSDRNRSAFSIIRATRNTVGRQ
jgi:hypothetical protein